MAYTTAYVTTSLLILLALVVGAILLQIFLSKRESKWPGLILPSITLFYSIIAVLSVAVFDGREVFMVIALVFLTYNIPTLILLGIYGGCRGKMKQHATLDKMKIQDLT